MPETDCSANWWRTRAATDVAGDVAARLVLRTGVQGAVWLRHLAIKLGMGQRERGPARGRHACSIHRARRDGRPFSKPWDGRRPIPGVLLVLDGAQLGHLAQLGAELVQP